MKANKTLRWLICSAAVVVVAPFIGLGLSLLFLRRAFDGTASVDPSDKAKFLAEGISESMNMTACGVVVSCLGLVPTIIFALRLHRESKQTTRPTAGPQV